MASDSIFNSLPGLSVVSNKRGAARIFNKMIHHYPKEYDFIPTSYCLPDDKELLQTAMKNSKSTFIVKPQAGSEGCGIFLV